MPEILTPSVVFVPEIIDVKLSVCRNNRKIVAGCSGQVTPSCNVNIRKSYPESIDNCSKKLAAIKDVYQLEHIYAVISE